MPEFYGFKSDGSRRGLAVTDEGALKVDGAASGGSSKATTATRSSVNAAASDTQLVDADGDRLGVSVFNDANVDLYLVFGGTTASTSNYTIKMATGGFYEVPAIWAGLEIRGIWSASPTGAARITEVS